MSNGSGFFAMSDEQLKRLLSGELPYGPFLQASGGEQPREAHEQEATRPAHAAGG